MPRFSLPPRATEPNVEFFCLHDAKPDGATVASFRGQSVSDVVIDAQGYRYVFVGLAPRKPNGSYDVKPLKAGEVILEPGLLYQLIPVKGKPAA